MHRSLLPLVLVLAPLAGCAGKPPTPLADATRQDGAVATTSSRTVACAILTKDDMNRLTDATYTAAESDDDGHSSETSCHYSSPTDPAGASVTIDWISPDEYSDPAEHLALQQASIAGARLGGKLISNTVGGAGAIKGAPSGPVEGLGDEATMSLLLLTARRGDYTVTVQIIPGNMMALMTDSTVAMALVAKEKAVVAQVLAKL